MKPLTFEEYLIALEKPTLLKALAEIPCPTYAHQTLLQEFYTYTLLGGMPEVIAQYSVSHDLVKIKDVYEALLRSYLDDVDKYAPSQALAPVIRFAIESAFHEAANRIKFAGFGQSNYRSREMGEALKILEKAMLLNLMYPTTGWQLPIITNEKKSPRLHLLDTGLVNYFSGLQAQLFGTQDLDHFYQGRIAEHIVGQELMAVFTHINEKISFWVREKAQANAEIDYVLPFEQYEIPIEVKAGSVGRLRSLHEFIEAAPHNFAIRVYSGDLSIDKVATIKSKKEFTLLNLPFYLAGQIKNYLPAFISGTLNI